MWIDMWGRYILSGPPSCTAETLGPRSSTSLHADIGLYYAARQIPALSTWTVVIFKVQSDLKPFYDMLVTYQIRHIRDTRVPTLKRDNEQLQCLAAAQLCFINAETPLRTSSRLTFGSQWLTPLKLQQEKEVEH